MTHANANLTCRLVTVVVAVVVLGWLALVSSADAQTWSTKLAQEPACQTLTPAAAGGPMPSSQNLVVLRYLGVSNYELAYRNVVVLLDAGFERLPWWVPTGVSRQDLTKHVDAIFVGHAHGEHIWDAPFIAQKTGALVVTEPIGMKWIRSTGLLADRQMAVVKGGGGEIFKFNGFTVQVVKGHHNIVPGEYMEKDRAAAAAISLKPPLNPEEEARLKTFENLVPLTREESQALIADGTMTYFLQFDSGFRLWYGDSAGPTTASEQEMARQVGSVDVGLIPYYGGELALPITMEYVRLLKPRIVLPTHHDGHRARMLDMPLGPLALAVREEFPKTRVLSPLYRSPVCIDTATREVYVGE